jgi:hypothetical protein
MKGVAIILLFLGLSSYTHSQEECIFDFFVVDQNELKELTADRIELAFSSIDANCLKRNAEYSEMVNEFIFLCLTHQSSTTIDVLSKNKCELFYRVVLDEIANPVADTFDFQAIYCNISTLEGKNTKRVRNEVLDRFKEGILNIIPEANRIIQSDCL